MSLFESIERPSGAGTDHAAPGAPAIRRAAMLEHPSLAVAAIQKGRIRETNASWKTLFALPTDISVESHVATLFSNGSSADKFERQLHLELTVGGRSGLVARAEHMLMRRDGTAFLAEIVVWLFAPEDVARPLGGDAIWQVRDITVERTLRRELRDLEDYHRELSRHQWDMTFVIDRKGRIAYASPSIESVLGYHVPTLLGESFTSVLDPTHAAAAEQWLRTASLQQRGESGVSTSDDFRLRVLHSDGSLHVLSCRPRDCFDIPRIAGMVVHAREVPALAEPLRVEAGDARKAALRTTLIKLARSPSASPEDRIGSLLNAIRVSIDASTVTLWRASGEESERVWVPHAVVRETSVVEGDGLPPPLLSGLSPSTDSVTLVVDNVRDSPSIGPETAVALQASGTAAVLEVPVLDHGEALGWLAVAAPHPHAWTDPEIDFVVSSALLVALAVRWQNRQVVEVAAPVVAPPDVVPEAVHVAAAAPTSSPVDAERLSAGGDGLTGLPDRIAATRHLATRIAEADGQPLVALVVDLDRLQDINDSLGFAVGDASIARTAHVLLDIAGPSGFVGRIGGDEFLVVVHGVDALDVDSMAQSILDRLGSVADDGSDGLAIEASVGIARLPFEGTDAATLLLQADLAMREAKNRGRGQAFVFNPKVSANLRIRKGLDAEIEGALLRNEFVVFYQPQVALGSGEVVGLEALLRWQHPTWGLLLPDTFIAPSVQRGLIDAITKLALTKVCEQVAGWLKAGDFKEIPVTVNVSGRQFHDRRLPALVASALMKSGLAARLLVLEITEQSLIGDDAGLERVVKELSRLGVRIAIGDFNVGHASFQYLRQLRVSQVKIDGGFVKGLPDDNESAIVVSSVVNMAHRLKYEVVAEGVETREQFEHLRGIGCEIGQGFYMGAPLSPGDVRAFLETNKKNPIH